MARVPTFRLFTASSRALRVPNVSRRVQSNSIHVPSATPLPRLSRPARSQENKTSVSQRRWLQQGTANNTQVYDFEKMKEASSKPSSDRILIDVREPHEYTAGFIPTSINIPVSSQPDALFLPPDEFEERFGFSKPDTNAEVVFYCKAGVRSKAAANLAEQSGYQKVSEYRGSWLDWQKNGGKTDMP